MTLLLRVRLLLDKHARAWYIESRGWYYAHPYDVGSYKTPLPGYYGIITNGLGDAKLWQDGIPPPGPDRIIRR
jgi:hypothetical protein